MLDSPKNNTGWLRIAEGTPLQRDNGSKPQHTLDEKNKMMALKRRFNGVPLKAPTDVIAKAWDVGKRQLQRLECRRVWQVELLIQSPLSDSAHNLLNLQWTLKSL